MFIYLFDRIVTPTVIAVSEAEMRAKSVEVLHRAILDEMSKKFSYDEIIEIEKDKEDNIALIKADTIKLNKIACDVALKSQNELNDLGNVGIKLPIGYITKNNILSYFGPSITVKMQPIGYIEATYDSSFESAGINQTRHKIYIKLKSRVRIIIPLASRDVDIVSEIPVAETIIVGKIPKTAIQMDLKDAGFKINGGE